MYLSENFLGDRKAKDFRAGGRLRGDADEGDET